MQLEESMARAVCGSRKSSLPSIVTLDEPQSVDIFVEKLQDMEVNGSNYRPGGQMAPTGGIHL